MLVTHPADNLKDKCEEHRGLHAVVGAARVLERPVWPTAENHNRPLNPRFMLFAQAINVEWLSKYVNFLSVLASHPDESDNLKKAGHSSEATQQSKATPLRWNQSWKNVEICENLGTGDPAVS